jgi:WS/DGAT/MGAT family acyltransferase
MERLSGLDATFLYVETHTAHMHVAMTGIYDMSTMPGGYSFDAVKAVIRSRLQLVAPFRRRLVQVPFRFHHPVWIEDPEFNLDYHVRRIGCPAPGGRRELAEVAAQIASIPLDRNRPLWEAWVIEGLKHDRFAMVVKVHHSAIDGASGAEIMTELFDLEPTGRDLEPTELTPERVPTDKELLTYATISKLRRTVDAFDLARRTVSGISSLVQAIRDPTHRHGAVPLTAPRTPWNHTISPYRSVSFARIPLEETKAVKDALGVKLNDVILAVCAGTLRNYLAARDELPDSPLLATCPVSVRVEDEMGSLGNKVSAMFASLATDVEDPAERVRAIAESTMGAKSDHDLVGARTLTDWAEWAAPRTFGLAMRLYGSMHLADAMGPIHNLVISNVPGPPFPLFMAGAELVAAYPMGPVMDGAGLNITVLSYRDHIDFGFMADRELIPDVWDMADGIRPAFEELKAVAGRDDPTIVKRAAPVTATSKSAKRAAKKRPATKRPATKRPATKKGAATKRPATKKAAARKAPAKKRPATKDAAAEKPAAEKGAARKTAPGKPTAVKAAEPAPAGAAI